MIFLEELARVHRLDILKLETEAASMKSGTTRETTITLDAETVDAASDLGLDISAVAQAAIQEVVAEARRKKWLADNVDVFAAQTDWHEHHGHPLDDIMTAPAAAAWKR